MNLTAGTVIDMLDGSSVTVQAFLADGGQGEVYRVIRSDGKVKALKWYVNPRLVSNVAFRTTLRNNSQRRPPSSAFLWPEGLTRVQYGSFGYIMRLRPPGYYDLGDFFCIDRYPDAWFRSYMARINAALRICDSFSSLHNSGLSYQDVNDGNFLINPATGDVLICDTDNIVPDGHNNGVSGKSRYMAPEVAAGNIPSRASDRLSLAIILYRIFMLDHPFEGRNTVRERYRCLTPESEKYLYGRGAVFCYDPANASNRPVGGIHGNSILYWPMLPKFFREAFGKALSRAAINCPADRTSASEWKKILLTARALTLTCHADPDDGIHDFTASPDYGGVCPVCGHTTPKWVTLA
ncbi:MAG: serine/threonine-protein kinase, partial [Muribaculaceae bacterium]|nr:serine/threonine-protein kinase [Muribaculaceae bacterium]